MLKIIVVAGIGTLLLGALAFYRYFPENTCFMADISGGRTLVLSRTGISVAPPPEMHDLENMDQLDAHVD